MLRAKIILSISISLISFSGFGAVNLSLNEALKSALKDNREISAARASVESAQEQYDASLGKYMPTLNLEGKYTHLNDDIDIDLSDIRRAMIGSAAVATQVSGGNPATTTGLLSSSLPDFTTRVQKQDFFNATLVLTQPIYAGGKISANKDVKKELYKSSITEKENVEGKTLGQIIQSYYLVQLADKSRLVRSEALAGMKQHQKNAVNLMKAGQISKAQKMKVDVSVNEAERELSKSERDVKIAMKVLASTLNKPEEEFNLTTDLDMPKAAPMTDFSKAAEIKSPVLRQIQHKKELLNAKKTMAQSDFLPTVAAFGKYELYKHDLTTLEPEWAVGVALKMNLFNGGADKSELNAVKKDQIVLDNLDRNAHDMVKIGIEKIYSDVMSAQEQYQSLLKSQELAIESLKLNSNAFVNGFNKSTDVIDSQVMLASVKLALQKALYDYNTNLAQLYILSGQGEKLLEVYAENKTTK